ncbi:AAR176Cp [Eremothecium gossypii ATCC 10895]|uniref:AAR176Cp n=1 Tax=Eremothecium gossypii (strain ATCC 10895 / CBS 109.51 / FGSC 9923 / NRRL Y-1056) TaxID=284811 RepID=Q75EA1_EREGS|nr:AAR176Cp [Eremothecium gossypii ATCC 10895]AAS50543.1 AAR176Cp [Eremothecium gossypii ATCC 10895]AEY94830.1 FAAR176Cp [Eremothecium gossypii FDAG1]
MSDNKIDESIDKARSGAKNLIDKASDGSKKLAKDAKKGLEKGESELQRAAERVGEWLSGAAAGTWDVAAKTAGAARDVASKVFVELQNPVVAVNAVLGGGALMAWLHGYAEHQSRYLQGKTDRAILATVGGVAALVAADGLLSYKYYRQFDRK